MTDRTPRFTPGPWSMTARDTRDAYYLQPVLIYSGPFDPDASANAAIAFVESAREEDARLIAAAPDLYAALLEVRPLLVWVAEGRRDSPPDVIDFWLARATAALARVAGEAGPPLKNVIPPQRDANE